MSMCRQIQLEQLKLSIQTEKFKVRQQIEQINQSVCEAGRNSCLKSFIQSCEKKKKKIQVNSSSGTGAWEAEREQQQSPAPVQKSSESKKTPKAAGVRIKRRRSESSVFPSLQSALLMNGCTPAPLRKTHN